MKIASGLVLLFVAATTVECINVATKLDFQDARPKLFQTVFVRPKQDPLKSEGAFEKVGIVCASEGCNTTKTEIQGSDTISADIVVEVKTNIDVNESKNKSISDEEIPDVPVVIGYGGVQENPPDARDNSINPNQIIVTDMEQSFPQVNDFMPAVRVSADQNFIPYFEPTYQNHQYGEHQPPRPIWYPRKSIHNPLEFKANWHSTNPWYSRRNDDVFVPYRTTKPPPTVCTCLQTQQARSGWYPTTSNYQPLYQQPGTQINDKLASLN